MSRAVYRMGTVESGRAEDAVPQSRGVARIEFRRGMGPAAEWAVRDDAGDILLEARAHADRLTAEELAELVAMAERIVARRRLRLVK